MPDIVPTPTDTYSTRAETAFLVCIRFPDMADETAREHLAELGRLVDTMGLRVLGSMVAGIKQPQPRYLMGSGKAKEIAEAAAQIGADCIVFDDDLSPSQQRNLEELADLCVIDRREVILDIFAEHATTREAVLQVGLARMEYSLPRLTRAWTHLSRQRGGRRGTRGEGETQLEADRRIVLARINKMKKELVQVRRQRATRRKRRRSVPVPTGALVGYTNAGKSSLLNAMTGAGVLVEDKLFATLDPTTRRVSIKNGADVLLTDTVGFIRKLPHDLVDAFKSTLEEATVSDFIIHVVDASSPEVDQHFQTTTTVLEELGAGDKPSVIALNKADLVPDDVRSSLENRYPDAVFTSAADGRGLDDLAQRLKRLVYAPSDITVFELPTDRHDLAALVYRTGRVVEEHYNDDHILLTAQVPEKTLGLLADYLVTS